MTLALRITGTVPLTAVFGQAPSGSGYSEHFIESRGVKLHSLDWGGQGEPLVILTGFGTPADTFGDLAVGLRDRFHVYALTRRGMAPSAVPASGYELEMLVADVIAFLDAKQLARVHLVGHSIAGLEMTEIASRWPERVRSLVYLDAIADPASAHAVLQKDPLNQTPSTGAVWAEINRWWSGHSVNFQRVKSPTLAITALEGRRPDIPPDASAELRSRAQEYWRTAIVPLKERWIATFQQQVPQAKMVTFEGADHYFYLSRGAETLTEMRRFYDSAR
ncbi:MAG: alpha/beta hydrolase [Acidobacteria bacterium]|nr:alpha/beta hydrolase [Acidobacteriota bacterium]